MRAIQKFAFLASLSVLVGCSEPGPIRIGFIAGLEGRASALGIASRNAVQMAVDEANANGGINGRQIELVIRDDKRSAKGGAEAARSLVSEKVTAIIGPILSVVAGGVVPVINEARLVTVSPTVISSKFVGKDDFFFRLNSSGEQSAADYARVYHEAGFSRIAAATDAHNKAFTENWMKLFTAAFSAYGGKISSVVPFDAAKEVGLKHVVVSLLADKPEAVLILANGIDTAQLVQQFRKRDGDIQLLATSWAGSDNLITHGGRAVEGIMLADTYDRNDQSKRYLGFREGFQGKFKAPPNHASVASYDAATTLFAALRTAGEGGNLKAALLNSESYKALQQEITFDAYGDSRRTLTVVMVRDGRFARPK
ncbi:ABC transporter substrate-binding protein [Nisaea sp.]|uniref:ABC transporter substrate-binding protein n=1 Tax=Nisaea sp. TaxID=2024842 RepID=UPI0032669720